MIIPIYDMILMGKLRSRVDFINFIDYSWNPNYF